MEEALDLHRAWAIKCLVKYRRELSVSLSFVILMPFLDPCIGLYCDVIHSIKTTASVRDNLVVIFASIATGTRSFIVVIFVSFLRSSGPVNIQFLVLEGFCGR